MNNLETEIKTVLCINLDNCLPYMEGSPKCTAKDSIACPISNASIHKILALFAELEANLALAEKKYREAVGFVGKISVMAEENCSRYCPGKNYCNEGSCSYAIDAGITLAVKAKEQPLQRSEP